MVRRALALAASLSCACGEGRIVPAAAPVEITPLALDFGPILAGASVTLRLHLRNPGRSPATVVLEAPLPFEVLPPVVDLPGAGRAEVQVRVRATSPGPQRATLRVAGAGVRRSVPLSAVVLAPAIEVPAALEFDQVRVREWSKVPLVVRSVSDVPLEVALTLRDPDHAFVVDTTELRLEPGAEHALVASFAPPRRGAFEGVVELKPCPTCPASTVKLRGMGAVEALSADMAALDFGAVSPGRALSRTIALTNSGDLPLRLVAVAEGQGFSVPRELALAAGETERLVVTFAPDDLRRFQAVLQITGGRDPVLLRIPLTGRGGGPELAVDPGRLDFGLQPLGIQAIRRAHLLDPGQGALHVTGVAFEGRGAGAFSLDPLPSSLPLEVGARPVPIAVRFLPPLEGAFEAELVLTTDDEDGPEVRVPVTGQALLAPPCDVRVTPASLGFGLVHRGTPATRSVLVSNVGSTRCFLSEVELSPQLGAFQLDGAPSSTFLAPGETLPIVVRFTPGAKVIRTATLRLRVSDPVRPDRYVALSGAGTDLDLAATPDPLDFGGLPVGYRGIGSITLSSQGQGTAHVTALRVGDGAGSGPFQVLGDAPSTLEAGRPATIALGYLPRAAREDEDTLEVELAGEAAPLLVGLRGRGDDRPCGVLCADPVASCADRISSRVSRAVEIPGSGWDPAGSAVSCRWRVLRAPEGSREVPATSGRCGASFVPDMVGDYELQLVVTDPQLQTASCVTRLSATAPERGLWVELFWSLDDDVDLHLLHPDAGDARDLASWFDGELDCYYNNMNPDWDVPGDAADDPSLDRDDTVFTGPENVRLDVPVPGHAYRVGVNWFSNVNRFPWLDATTTVYCEGALASRVVTTLTEPGELVVLGTVTFDGLGGCSVDGDGTRLLP